MSARFIISSRFPVKEGSARAVVDLLGQSEERRVFISLEADEVLELRALEDEATLACLGDMFMPQAGSLAQHLQGDVRRELLSFVEAPKGCDTPLPMTPFIQLRHVEVKPEQMAAYRKWRNETIFEVVRGHDAAEIFLAYHSVISGQPGVMFVAGFSASPQEYVSAFTSEHYSEIVRQAGTTYITGGTDGLYTKIYESPLVFAA